MGKDLELSKRKFYKNRVTAECEVKLRTHPPKCPTSCGTKEKRRFGTCLEKGVCSSQEPFIKKKKVCFVRKCNIYSQDRKQASLTLSCLVPLHCLWTKRNGQWFNQFFSILHVWALPSSLSYIVLPSIYTPWPAQPQLQRKKKKKKMR